MNIFKGLFDEYGIFKLTWDAEKALNYSKNGMRVILFGDNSIRLLPEDSIYSVNREQVEYFEHLGEDSCVEISTDGRILTTYSISGDNTLYITDKCNSNCIMCPMGEYVRKNGKSINTDVLKQMIRYMPQGI